MVQTYIDPSDFSAAREVLSRVEAVSKRKYRTSSLLRKG
jgi:hypothetical protein